MSIGNAINEALALHKQGAFPEAEAGYRTVLKKNPKEVRVMQLLGSLLVQTRRPEEAARVLTRAVTLRPDYALARHTLAIAQRQLGDLSAALASHGAGLSRQPDDPSAHNNIGVVYEELGDYARAREHFETAVELKPDYAEALGNLGMMLKVQRRWEASEDALKQALALRPQHPSGHINLGLLYLDLSCLEEARERFDHVLTLQLDHGGAVAGIAEVLERQGEYDAAYERLLPLVKSGRASTGTIAMFGTVSERLKREDGAREALDILEAAMNQPGLPLAGRVRMGFVAGSLCNSMKEYDRAFGHYRRANDLAKQAAPFDVAEDRHRTDALIQTFSAQGVAKLARATDRSELPVFIVGMPRSGTSLVEQILASHPRVHGGGERLHLPMLVETLPQQTGGLPYPDCLATMDTETLDGIAREHLQTLAELDPSATRVTDKLPHNFLHLGLISMLFPGARVIHCTRDATDTCLSCYFHHFVGGHAYAHDLTTLGTHHRHCEELMAHWKQVLDLPIMEIPYEQMVADQEALSRRMIDFCGLEWDDACLRFHESKRNVNTASYHQVRQPIYKKSVQRWRRYADHLEPLKKTLEGV